MRDDLVRELGVGFEDAFQAGAGHDRVCRALERREHPGITEH
jgi:hypothetical protein